MSFYATVGNFATLRGCGHSTDPMGNQHPQRLDEGLGQLRSRKFEEFAWHRVRHLLLLSSPANPIAPTTAHDLSRAACIALLSCLLLAFLRSYAFAPLPIAACCGVCSSSSCSQENTHKFYRITRENAGQLILAGIVFPGAVLWWAMTDFVRRCLLLRLTRLTSSSLNLRPTCGKQTYADTCRRRCRASLALVSARRSTTMPARMTTFAMPTLVSCLTCTTLTPRTTRRPANNEGRESVHTPRLLQAPPDRVTAGDASPLRALVLLHRVVVGAR